MPTPQAPSNQPESIKVILISSLPDDHVLLRHIFDHSNWVLHTAPTCREALAYACAHDIPVVICERDLPDGDWKLVLSEIESLPLRPNLIVTSRLADEGLWAEVLNLGGYDVLAQPFDSEEVYRVVFLAWQEQKRRAWASAERKFGLNSAQATVGAVN